MIRDTEVREAGAKGLGVFARRQFAEGEFIFRRRHGRILRADEVSQLADGLREHITELDFEHVAVLLPPGAYLNHSCDPNAIRRGVNVHALRAIAQDEEITIEYRLNAFADGEMCPCHCGAPQCTGVIEGSFFAMPPDRQRAYLRWAPPFIRREYWRRYGRAGRGAVTARPGAARRAR